MNFSSNSTLSYTCIIKVAYIWVNVARPKCFSAKVAAERAEIFKNLNIDEEQSRLPWNKSSMHIDIS